MKMKFKIFLMIFVMSFNASFFEWTMNDNSDTTIYARIVSKMNEKQLELLINLNLALIPLSGVVFSIPISSLVINSTFLSKDKMRAKLFIAISALGGALIGRMVDKELKLAASKRFAQLHSSESKNEC